MAMKNDILHFVPEISMHCMLLKYKKIISLHSLRLRGKISSILKTSPAPGYNVFLNK